MPWHGSMKSCHVSYMLFEISGIDMIDDDDSIRLLLARVTKSSPRLSTPPLCTAVQPSNPRTANPPTPQTA